MTSGPLSLEPREPRAPEEDSATASPSGVEPLDAHRPPGRSWMRWALPLAAFVLGVAIYAALVATRDRPQTRDVLAPSPLVRVLTVEPEDLRMTVRAQGTVMPRTESDVVAEVRGRVVWISPNLEVGGFFEEGEELLRLDQREYRIARDRARANVTLRESEARLAKAEAARRRELRRRGAASAADLEQFENRELVATASLSESRAVLEQAELDYERTVLRAPYAGRVRERNVDVGRFVSAGTKLARLFAVDFAEVRLPIQTDDLAFLDIDLMNNGANAVDGARVSLTGRLAGREFVWPAELVRAEAAIDQQTRMLYVVARVADPYALETPPAGPPGTESKTPASPNGQNSGRAVPLPAGLFVTAQIEGRSTSGVFVLPMMALRDDDRVFVAKPVPPVESEDLKAEKRAGAMPDPIAERPGVEARLEVREVSVLRRDRERVLIDSGLESGDQVVISPLRIYSEGMRLRVVEAEDS